MIILIFPFEETLWKGKRELNREGKLFVKSLIWIMNDKNKFL